MNHTPGPWHVERPFKEKGTYIAHTESTALIARVYEGNTIVGKTLPDQGQANARLIAAAPELLIALQECGNCLGEYQRTGHMPGWDLALRNTLAAIRKATTA